MLLSGTTFYEGDGIETVIGMLGVKDVDKGDSHTFTLLEGGRYFEIVGETLRVRQVPSVSQTIEVSVADRGGLVYSESFTIAVRSRGAAGDPSAGPGSGDPSAGPGSSDPSPPAQAPDDDGPGDGPGGDSD